MKTNLKPLESCQQNFHEFCETNILPKFPRLRGGGGIRVELPPCCYPGEGLGDVEAVVGEQGAPKAFGI